MSGDSGIQPFIRALVSQSLLLVTVSKCKVAELGESKALRVSSIYMFSIALQSFRPTPHTTNPSQAQILQRNAFLQVRNCKGSVERGRQEPNSLSVPQQRPDIDQLAEGGARLRLDERRRLQTNDSNHAQEDQGCWRSGV